MILLIPMVLAIYIVYGRVLSRLNSIEANQHRQKSASQSIYIALKLLGHLIAAIQNDGKRIFGKRKRERERERKED